MEGGGWREKGGEWRVKGGGRGVKSGVLPGRPREGTVRSRPSIHQASRQDQIEDAMSGGAAIPHDKIKSNTLKLRTYLDSKLSLKGLSR